MRTAFVVAFLCACFIAASLARSASHAAACSLAPLELRSLPDLVERTPIIAIGTWVESGEYEATLLVDESLKGTRVGARHVFDNRGAYTMVACSPYDEEFHSGFRFEVGQRSVVFVEKQVDGLWQIAWSSYAVFDAPADDLASMPMWQVENPPMLVADVRAAVAAGPELEPDEREALEVELGCNPPFLFNPQKVAEYSGLAAAGVAIVTVLDSPPLIGEPTNEPVVARIDEVLAGKFDATATITLNDRWISDSETNDCQPQVENGRRAMVEGSQYLVFLRADEYGIATFRPVAWGRGAIEINEKYLTGGQITLARVRDLTGTQRSEPASSGVTPAGDATRGVEAAVAADGSDSEGPGRLTPVIVAIGGAVTLLAAWFVGRSRRGTAG